MSQRRETPGEGSDPAANNNPPRYSLDVQSALVSDGFAPPVPDLPAEDAPPPYGELHDQLQFSQSGFEAGANVTRRYPKLCFAPRLAVRGGISVANPR